MPNESPAPLLSAVSRLTENRTLTDEEFTALLETDACDEALFEAADRVRRSVYGTDVYVRGLIEFTNCCKNDCFYCGIRRSNKNASRYRLDEEEILGCCFSGWELGYRTFVLQGGEDPFFTDEKICRIVSRNRRRLRDSRNGRFQVLQCADAVPRGALDDRHELQPGSAEHLHGGRGALLQCRQL